MKRIVYLIKQLNKNNSNYRNYVDTELNYTADINQAKVYYSREDADCDVTGPGERAIRAVEVSSVKEMRRKK